MIPIGMDGKEGKKQFLFENKVAKAKDIPFTNMTVSPDSSKVAFTAVFDSNTKKKATEIYTAVIDKQGILVWDKFVSLKGNQKQYDIEDFQLNNSGELLILSKYYRNDKGKNTIRDKNNEKQAGYTMNIFRVTSGTRQAQKIPIMLKRSFVHQAAMIIDSVSGHLYCAGLTSVKSGGNINGVFVSEFDTSLSPVKAEQRNFSIKELIALHKTDADISLSSNKEGLDDEYVLSSLHLSRNGELAIIAEENFVRTYNNNMGRNGFYNSGSTSTELNSNDVVIINLSSDGNISKLNVVPKKQASNLHSGRNYFNPDIKRLRESDLFMSHGLMNNDGDFYFLYNEHKDNFDDKGRRKTVESVRRMQPAIVHASLSEDQELNPLFEVSAESYVISPTRSRQIDNKTYFITLVQPTINPEKYIKIGLIKFH